MKTIFHIALWQYRLPKEELWIFILLPHVFVILDIEKKEHLYNNMQRKCKHTHVKKNQPQNFKHFESTEFHYLSI